MEKDAIDALLTLSRTRRVSVEHPATGNSVIIQTGGFLKQSERMYIISAIKEDFKGYSNALLKYNGEQLPIYRSYLLNKGELKCDPSKLSCILIYTLVYLHLFNDENIFLNKITQLETILFKNISSTIFELDMKLYQIFPTNHLRHCIYLFFKECGKYKIPEDSKSGYAKQLFLYKKETPVEFNLKKLTRGQMLGFIQDVNTTYNFYHRKKNNTIINPALRFYDPL